MFATHPKVATAERLCSSCGASLIGTRCPECSPVEPARAYHERVTQPVVAGSFDSRRATGEWMTAPEERDPQTRKAHPTLVRAALDEAEERARDRLARVALVPLVSTTPPPLPDAARPRSTAPRLRPVTPLPPDPDAPPSVIVVKSMMAAVPSAAPSIESPVPPSAPPSVVSAHAPVAVSAVAEAAPRGSSDAPVEGSPDDDPSRRRVLFFWLGLVATTVAVLAVAAL